MCQIIVKPEGKKVDFEKLNKAQEWNEDGYGVTWWEFGELNTFKTMEFKRFKALLSTLKDTKAVIHLRNTTRGKTCNSNNHPFKIKSGVLFHNGTVNGLSCSVEGGSDTLALSELINACDYNYIEDILPLVKHIIGNTINRLVFFEDDGEITIVNENLGMWENGIWYSNDYHKKEVYVPKPYTAKGTEYTYNPTTKTWEPKDRTKSMEPKNDKKMTKVFVYGTLKKGYGNHYLLKNSKFVGEATSVSNWLMIGKDMAFPYLIKRDHNNGKIIKGEVYEVDEDTLKKLDILEGVPTHYKKETIYVSYKNGNSSENVTVYVKATPINEKYLSNIEFIDEFVGAKKAS
jgi:gamma-glutamylcyclotransferase (GGCT)/AIG2-like uncharacterized protein YtfP